MARAAPTSLVHVAPGLPERLSPANCRPSAVGDVRARTVRQAVMGLSVSPVHGLARFRRSGAASTRSAVGGVYAGRWWRRSSTRLRGGQGNAAGSSRVWAPSSGPEVALQRRTGRTAPIATSSRTTCWSPVTAGRASPTSGSRTRAWRRQRTGSPTWLQRGVARGMEPAARRRYPSLVALLADLQKELARSRSLAVLVAVGLGLASCVWGW